MAAQDGGPAFPKPDTIENKECYAGDFPRVIEHSAGMTLRDWFAGQAIAAILRGTQITPWDEDKHPEGRDESLLWNAVAHDCYALADALIAARHP